jgi:hypothetical protein
VCQLTRRRGGRVGGWCGLSPPLDVFRFMTRRARGAVPPAAGDSHFKSSPANRSVTNPATPMGTCPSGSSRRGASVVPADHQRDCEEGVQHATSGAAEPAPPPRAAGASSDDVAPPPHRTPVTPEGAGAAGLVAEGAADEPRDVPRSGDVGAQPSVESGLGERAEAFVAKAEAAWGVADDAVSALTGANTAVVAKGATAAVQALLKVAGRFPLAGPIADVLSDVWALYKVGRRAATHSSHRRAGCVVSGFAPQGLLQKLLTSARPPPPTPSSRSLVRLSACAVGEGPQGGPGCVRGASG